MTRHNACWPEHEVHQNIVMGSSAAENKQFIDHKENRKRKNSPMKNQSFMPKTKNDEFEDDL